MSAVSLKPTRDDRHYWDTIIFQVEDRLFKVPTYLLQKEQDSAFAGMLSLPQGVLNPEGASDDHPIKLDADVTKVDFSRLLDVMYPITVPSQPQYDEMSKDEWISVLKLSDKFQLLEIRELAIKRLTESSNIRPSSIEMIQYGRQFSVGDWLIRGYRDLIRRPASMAFEDAEMIGWENLAKICIERETLLRASVKNDRYKENVVNAAYLVSDWDGQSIVERAFEEELKSVGYSHQVATLDELNGTF
ncbi:hypothetical protein C8J56DRAFT_1160558 [Mycena floridula]|nr:hypothetical protein C8J56DRAFT_1160558 [Mycena floridula]